jgi:hypothetical protein
MIKKAKSHEDRLDSLKFLQKLIFQMEGQREENPEYIVRNIELLDKIIEILNKFKKNLIERIPTS